MKSLGVVLLITAALITTGCTSKKVVKQKDQEIASLQEELDQLKVDLATQEEMNTKLQSELADLQQAKNVWIDERERLTHITLEGSASFASARAELTPEAKQAIDYIWRVVQEYPDRWILIEGHADDQAINKNFEWKYKSNWELSSARAHAVLHYLVEQLGASPSRVRAVGCGEYDPVGDNGNPEGRAKNRRVVITIGSAVDIDKHVSR